jgi:hypothetical protein
MHSSYLTALPPATGRGDAMKVETKPVSEITQQAIELLCKEIGIVNTLRFLWRAAGW